MRLVLASNSNINEFLQSKHSDLDLTRQKFGREQIEIGCFPGFGRFRLSRYTQRLIRISILTVSILFAVLLSIGLDAAVKKIHLDQLHDEEELIREQASRAMVFVKTWTSKPDRSCGQ